VFTAHFYGHLREKQRQAFVTEARRVAGEVVVVDAALRPDKEPEELQERVLSDGSRHETYKRYFDPRSSPRVSAVGRCSSTARGSSR